jgi:4-hydroxybenzoate polyprenyltransferase
MGVHEAPLGSEDRARDPDASLPPLVRMLRIHHWTKNGFILLPLPFALRVGSQLDGPVFAAGLFGFCVLSSAVYVLNDLRDAETDRLNPRKRQRPIASGAISPATGWAVFAALALAALGMGLATGLPRVLALFGIYAGANLAYSFGAKNVPLLDVFILASGYVVRVLVGCALVQARPSGWLLLCSSGLALFLAFAKRRGDLIEGVGPDHRPALAGYSLGYLDAALAITAGVSLLSYALYSVEAGVLIPGRELAGLVFVAFAILDYLRLIYVHGEGASPVSTAFRHRSLQAAGLLWMLATAWSLGLF